MEEAMTSMLTLQTTSRAWARRTGLVPVLHKVLSVVKGREDYEERFGTALLEAMCPGDHVWDIGANLGLYTGQFSNRVGLDGSVCAFEPAPACFQQLLRMGLRNLQLFNVALGDRDATMPFAIANDPLGPTHSLADTVNAAHAKTIDVRVARGDTIRREEHLPVPSVIKIDVEGYEEEVLTGLLDTLREPNCRSVFVEVHFGVLDRRDQRQAPARIKTLLEGLGFETQWIDSSHLGAKRQTIDRDHKGLSVGFPGRLKTSCTPRR